MSSHSPKHLYSHIIKQTNYNKYSLYIIYYVSKQGRQTGLVSTPPEFWMGGLNTCQPPLILRFFFLGGGGLAPLKLI